MAVKLHHILGLNARNYEYLSNYNTSATRRIADSKLLTKSSLKKLNLPTPRLYKVFRKQSEVGTFDFTKINDSFVVKPNRGMGGKGIIVVEKAGKKAGTWITSERQKVAVQDLEMQIADILEGRFSMNDMPDIAFVEERVRIHPAFADYAYHGTPDIRVIVFNKVPVMAMLRIPTRESGGRANLFQGAVGAGIDLATGTATYAICNSEEILRMPDTKKVIRGLQIPEWEKVLELAIQCQEATGLGYLGADIVLQPSVKHPGKTIPKVLELNAQPGLKIQLCNKDGLRRRLERVEGLEVETVQKGIRIAQELFADRKVVTTTRGGLTKIHVSEAVKVKDADGKDHTVKVKVDTGADRTSIDTALAESLGLLEPENILYEVEVENALGVHQKRQVVGITYMLAGRTITSTASVTDRSHLKKPMLVGRKDLKGFMIVFDE
jgi:alpha-L-glutamate ligase-like protein